MTPPWIHFDVARLLNGGCPRGAAKQTPHYSVRFPTSLMDLRKPTSALTPPPIALVDNLIVCIPLS